MSARPAPWPSNPAPLLLAGFDPFGGQTRNPSADVVAQLDGQRIAGHPVRGVVLPTRFDAALPGLLQAVEQVQPALVLVLGQAGGRAGLSLERVAINLVDASAPDNAGAQPQDQPVRAGGPAALFATLPVKAMRAALRDHGLPVELSLSAGSFVCNQVLYGLLDALSHRVGPPVPAGFLHLPWLPGQGEPCLPLAEQTLGVRLALEAALAA